VPSRNTHVHTPECAQPGSEPKWQTSINVYTHPHTHTYTCVNVHTHTNTHLCVPSRDPSQGGIPPTTPVGACARIRIQCRQKYSGIGLCMCDIFIKVTERPHPRHLLVHVRKSEYSGVKNTEISVCTCVIYLYIHTREKRHLRLDDTGWCMCVCRNKRASRIKWYQFVCV